MQLPNALQTVITAIKLEGYLFFSLGNKGVITIVFVFGMFESGHYYIMDGSIKNLNLSAAITGKNI